MINIKEVIVANDIRFLPTPSGIKGVLIDGQSIDLYDLQQLRRDQRHWSVTSCY